MYCQALVIGNWSVSYFDFCFDFQEEEEESDGLSADLNDILKTAAQTQSVLSPVENSESDVEDGQEKLTRDLRLSSTRAASMCV